MVLPEAGTTSSRDAAWDALLVALVAAAARLPLALGAPALTPDGQVYLRVAQNILRHGCVSLSDPAAGACVPHWGGNQLPGYPAFLALFGAEPGLALAVQAMLAGLACALLGRAVMALGGTRGVGLAAGLLAALSPVQVAWSRFVLPDALAAAATLWLFAELARSFADGRLRRLPVAVALVAATFLRYDGVLLCLPVAICGFALHRPAEALRRGAVIALVFALPLLAWSGRSAALGLGFVPQPRFMVDGSRSPEGYRSWVRTWSWTIYQAGAAGYPAATKEYGRIRVGPEAWDGEAERRRVEDLLARLRQSEGQDFPLSIDAAFAELAAERRARAPLRQWLELPARRAAQFWLNPYHSMGWPVELGGSLSASERAQLDAGGAWDRLRVALAHPAESLVKLAVAAWRAALLALAVLAAVQVARGRWRSGRALAGAALAFAAVRVLLLSLQASVDSRYMLPSFAAVELAGVLAAAAWLRQRAAAGGNAGSPLIYAGARPAERTAFAARATEPSTMPPRRPPAGLHEDLSRRHEVRQGSNRGFGLVFAVVFALIGLWPLLGGALPRWWALALAAAFVVLALAAPGLLAPLAAAWAKLGLLLHRVVNPLVMAMLFYLVVTPTGLLMRAFGKDPLRLKWDPRAKSYWIPREPPGPPGDTMKNQF